MLGHEGPPGGRLSLGAGPQRGHITVTARTGSVAERGPSSSAPIGQLGRRGPEKESSVSRPHGTEQGRGPALSTTGQRASSPTSQCENRPPRSQAEGLEGTHPRVRRRSCRQHLLLTLPARSICQSSRRHVFDTLQSNRLGPAPRRFSRRCIGYKS